MDKQHETAIDLATDYKAYLEDVVYESRAYSLKDYSYAMTAVNEIIYRLRDLSDVPPLKIIGDYSKQMMSFYTRKKHEFFSMASYTADDLIDLFM